MIHDYELLFRLATIQAVGPEAPPLPLWFKAGLGAVTGLIVALCLVAR
jgi:hypothetical protein